MNGVIREVMKAKILENAPVIIALHDTERNIVWANRAYREATGLTEKELIGKRCWVAWGLDRPCQNCPVTSAIETGLTAEAELTPENQDHWPKSQGNWLSRAAPLRDDKGAIVGVIETALEISKEKTREQKRLAEAEERFRAIAEYAMDAIIMIDDEGKVTYWNPAAEKMFGYSASEMIGKNVHEILMPEEYREQFKKGFRYFIKTGKGPAVGKVVELTAKHRSGAKIPIEITVSPVQRQGKYGAVGTIRDITERKRLADAFQAEKERLQTILDTIPVMITAYDPQSRMVLLNKEFERILGWRKEEAEKIDLIKEVYPDAEYRSKAWDFMMSASPEWREFKVKTKNGDIVESEWTNRRLSDGTEIGIGVDIRARKKAEEKISHQLRILSALYDSAQKITENLDLNARANHIVRIAVETFGCSLAWLGMAEKDGAVRLLAHYPEDFSYPQEITVRWDEFPEGRGPTGRAIRSGLPQITENISDDPRFIPWKDAALRQGRIASAAAFPLLAQRRTFGALILYSDQIGFFTGERVAEIQSFTHLAASTLENARLYEEGMSRIQRITALRNIDMAITGSLDLRVVTRLALDEIVKKLQVDAAAILRFDPYTMALEYLDGYGFRNPNIEKTRISLGHGAAGRVAQSRKVIHIADLSRIDDQVFTRRNLLKDDCFISYYGAPLVAKGKALGVLEVFHRTEQEGNAEWEEFLEILAGQVAIAFENAALVDDLRSQHTELIAAYNETIEGWGTALSLKEEETAEHSQRVTEMTVKVAKVMGMGEEELYHVRLGALLHDIGKIGIPDSILLKPGKLTDDEWEVMRKHPVYAFEMLAPIAYLRRASEIPYCHHEKWDGTGYPRGLKGNQIPLAARIFAVVDVWDALISDRPYRKAWPKDKVIEHIQKQSGTPFDPKVVECFIKIISEV